MAITYPNTLAMATRKSTVAAVTELSTSTSIMFLSVIPFSTNMPTRKPYNAATPAASVGVMIPP